MCNVGYSPIHQDRRVFWRKRPASRRLVEGCCGIRAGCPGWCSIQRCPSYYYPASSARPDISGVYVDSTSVVPAGVPFPRAVVPVCAVTPRLMPRSAWYVAGSGASQSGAGCCSTVQRRSSCVSASHSAFAVARPKMHDRRHRKCHHAVPGGPCAASGAGCPQ